MFNWGDRTRTPDLITDTGNLIDTKQIAEHSDKYFVNASRNLASRIPQLTLSHNYFLEVRTNHNLNIINMTANDIHTAINQQRNSLPGNDEIPFRVIKEINNLIIPANTTVK